MKWWISYAELKVAALMILSVMAVSGCSEGSSSQTSDEPSTPGAQTYLRFCFSCHQSGIGGAPRIGDTAAWAERSTKGREVLLQGVIDGIPPGMPRRGMCLQCSDQDLSDAIDYMISNSQPGDR